MRALLGLVISWCAYLNSLSPGTSSHCKRWTLILCAVTLYPRMHQCVACTKVMEILILTYSHVIEQGCCHFVARQSAIIFRVAVASTPRSLSMEVTKVEKCLQVYLLLRPLRLLQTLFWCLCRMGLGICVYDAHAVNTVGPILPEVMDQEVTLMLRGLQRWHG